MVAVEVCEENAGEFTWVQTCDFKLSLGAFAAVY